MTQSDMVSAQSCPQTLNTIHKLRGDGILWFLWQDFDQLLCFCRSVMRIGRSYAYIRSYILKKWEQFKWSRIPNPIIGWCFCMLLNHFKEARHDLWEHETAFDLTNTEKDQFVVVCDAVIGPEVVITLSSSLTTKWSRGRYQGCFGYY